MQFHQFRFPRFSEELHGECRLPDDGAGVPAVFLIADLLLSRRHGFYPFLIQALAVSRIVYGCDASSSGYRLGEDAIDGDKAKSYTLSSELADLLAVVGALHERTLCAAEVWDGERIALVGHGKGAALALHLDRRIHVEGLPVRCALVLLAPPSTLVREGWQGGGSEGRVRVPVTGAHDPDAGVRVPDAAEAVPVARNEDILLEDDFLADARELHAQATLEELIATTPSPVLLVAAEEDPVFPVDEAERLLRAGHSAKDRLVVVEKTGHNFGAAHPHAGTTPALVYVRGVIERFIGEVLA